MRHVSAKLVPAARKNFVKTIMTRETIWSNGCIMIIEGISDANIDIDCSQTVNKKFYMKILRHLQEDGTPWTAENHSSLLIGQFVANEIATVFYTFQICLQQFFAENQNTSWKDKTFACDRYSREIAGKLLSFKSNEFQRTCSKKLWLNWIHSKPRWQFCVVSF